MSLTQNAALNVMLGQNGYKILTTGNTSSDPDVVAITALEDSQVDLTGSTAEVASFPDATNLAIPKGVTIYGRWTSVARDSGTLVCYFG